MKKTTYGLLLLAMVLLVALALAGCGGNKGGGGGDKEKAPEKIVVKLSHVTSPESPKGKAAQKFAELIKERTNGRVEVQVFPSSQLYGDKEEMQALMANNVQIVVPSITKLVSMSPKYQVVDLPFLFPSEKAAYKFWDGEGGQKLLHELENQGIVGLAPWNNAYINIIGKKFFKTPDDFKGAKIRIPAGQVTTDVFTALGAGPSTIPFSEVYTSLQQGVVDAAITSLNNFDNEKHYEVAKYITILNLQRIEYIALTNKKFWDSLPEDIRKTMQETMNEVAKYERELSEQLNAQSLQKMKEAGTQVYQLSPEEMAKFEELFKPVYEKWSPVIGNDLVTLAQEARK